MSSHCTVNQFGRISRSHYIASTCPQTPYARLKKWTWSESQSESTSSLQYPPLQFSSLFLQHFFFNLLIYTYIGPQAIIDFAWAQTFQYIFPPSCTYSLLTTLWVKHGPKCRPVNCGSWGSSSDICPDTAHEHNIFSLKWNTELSTCKREELMISTYYYLNKLSRKSSPLKVKVSFHAVGHLEGFSGPFHCLAQYHYNSDKSQVREREPGLW
jgi:hypothetical protein